MTEPSAFGGSTDSLAVDGETSGWRARPVVALAIRVLVFMIPIGAAIGMVRLCVDALPPPRGVSGWGIWLFATTTVSLATVRVVDRFARRLLPLVAWFKMSLIFPDDTPSRMRLAMRRGTARDLERRISNGESLGADADEAARNLLVLLRRLNTHDRLTRGHSERVRSYADLIAEEMELPAADREKLHWGAMAHDAGKLCVPAELLNKQGQPTEQEWEILKEHPGAAEALLAPLRPWLGDWVDAATQHHERHDGRGYPAGLKGGEIHLSGRIVAVADAFDTMTSTRSYKKPLAFADARSELTRNAGTQFDPEVVRAFLAVGVGRLRLVAGPLAWLTSLPAATGASTVLTASGGAVASGATSLAIAATAVVAAVTAAEPIGSTETEAAPVQPVVERLADNETDSIQAPPTSVSRTPPDTTAVVPDSSPPVALAAAATTTTVNRPTTPPASESSTTSAQATTTSTGPTTTTSTTTTSTTTTSTTTTAPPTTSTTTTAPPVEGWAQNDAKSGEWNDTHTVWVLANDVPPAGFDYPTLAVVAQAANGTTTVRMSPGNPSNANINYAADAGFVGIDTFMYRICDLAGDCAQATVTFDSRAP